MGFFFVSQKRISTLFNACAHRFCHSRNYFFYFLCISCIYFFDLHCAGIVFVLEIFHQKIATKLGYKQPFFQCSPFAQQGITTKAISIMVPKGAQPGDLIAARYFFFLSFFVSDFSVGAAGHHHKSHLCDGPQRFAAWGFDSSQVKKKGK